MTNEQNKSDIAIKDVNVTKISVQTHAEYMDHETVYKIHAPIQNVIAFIGIHSTALGPSLGGIRYKHYQTEEEALGDVLRLSEAMTWKNAAGALNHGGGKGVVMAPDKNSRTPDQETLDVIAHGLNIINEDGPVYFGAEDMNFNEATLDYIAETAPWIKGVTSDDPSVVSGTPSPLTAIGVFECIKIAAQHKLGKNSLEGIRISMQGLGAVGGALAELLHKDNAILMGCDMADSVFDDLAADGVTIERVGLDDIYDVQADIFAPNAIGGTLTDDNIHKLKAAGIQIVCGAANNQQQDQIGGAQSRLMHELGILYCPDYIVNAGGVIWVAMVGQDAKTVTADITAGVPKRFEDVLKLHEQQPEKDLGSIALDYAQKRVQNAKERSGERKTG